MAINRPVTGFNLDSSDREIYRLSEYLAHNLAYKTWLMDGLVLNLENDERYPYVVKQVKVAFGGLHCFILQPQAECLSKEVFILFRGTKCGLSVLRDIEPMGAGASSILQELPAIIGEVNNTLSEITSRDVKITVCGHSLGGADAQNCFVALMKEATTNRKDFHKVTGLSLVAFNAAGVTQEVHDESLKLALLLKNKAIRLKCYWLHAAGDIVQQTGQATILAGVSSDMAQVHLVKAWAAEDAELKSYLELLSLFGVINRSKRIHTSHYFRNDVKESVGLEYYNNSTPEGQEIIRQKLSKKIVFLQNFAFTIPQYLIMRIRDYFGAALEEKKSEEKRMVHVKREPDLQDLLMNATGLSVVIRANAQPELRLHMAMPVPEIKSEISNTALVSVNRLPVEQIISILMPMFHEWNQQRLKFIADEIRALPSIRLIGSEARNFLDEKYVADVNHDDNVFVLNRDAAVLDIPEVDAFDYLLQPLPISSEDHISYHFVMLIGALLGVAASVAIAFAFPPAIAIIAGIAHVSTTALSGAAGAIGGMVLSGVTRFLYATLTQVAVAPSSSDILVAENNPVDNSYLSNSTAARLHRDHGIQIRVDAHQEVESVPAPVVPSSVIASERVPVLSAASRLTF